MSRRVSRLRTEPPDRRPVMIVGALVIGLLTGLILVPRLSPSLDGRVENYVLLASSLYAQGESPTLLRERLEGVGIAQPASTVLGMAQRYMTSRDKRQQNQAESLEAFGKVLLSPESASATTPTPRPTVAPTATVAPLDTPVPAAPAGVARGGPGPGAAAAAPTGAAPVPPAPSTAGPAAPNPAPPIGPPAPAAAAAPASAAPAAPGAVQRGRVKPPDGGSARLRKDPNTDGGTIALIPNLAPVEIQETVRGQVIDGENRWYRVRYGNNMVGYLWSKLVQVDG